MSEDVKPGSTVTFKITFYNNYTSTDDLEIRDVEPQVTIEGIDNGEDLEGDADSFDLDPDEDKKVTIKFDIPYKVSEDTYNILIEADGKDQNRTIQTIKWNLDLDLVKDRHKIRIDQAAVEPSSVQCGRSAEIDFELMNLGRDEEEEVAYSVISAALNLSKSEKEITMSEDPDDDTYTYQKAISFKISESVAPGTYPITIKSYYDTTSISETKNIDLAVEECKVVEEIPIEEESSTSEEEEVVVQQQPSEETATAEVINPPSTVEEAGSASFYDSKAFLAILIGAEILAVLIGLMIVVKIVRK